MSTFPRPFRFLLNCVDHYQAAPTSIDPQIFKTKYFPKSAPTIPLIRVFGATETGQKVCAHIHGAFPYLYIQYEGGLEEDAVEEYIRILELSINHALALSYRRNPSDQTAGTFVAHISLVKGVPFFGYHVGYKFFLKIYLLNPLNMTRLADLLIQGAVLARVFQPHESHMQYLAQWMCDYNLFGCSYIDCEKVRFRGPIPMYEETSSTGHKWDDVSIQPDWMSDEDEFPRMSHCTLEIDLCVPDIINRKEVRPRYLHQDLMERFQELGADEKFVHSMAGLWRDETIRRKKKMGLNDSGSSPFGPEVMISMSADPRGEKSDWIHEQEYRELVNRLINQERRADGGKDVGFEDFLNISKTVEDRVHSIFDSIEDLYPENLKKLQALQNNLGPPMPEKVQSALINEESILQLPENEDDGYHSDEDLAKELFLSQRTVEVKIRGETNALNGIEGKKDHGPAGHIEADIESSPSDGHYNGMRFPAVNDTDFCDGAIENTVLSSLKRKRVSQPLPVPSKQESQTSALSTGPSNLGKGSAPRRVAFQNIPVGSQDSSAPSSSSQLSQSSLKAHGTGAPGPMSFPTIKNPHDADIEFRLSQRPEYANSQTLRTPAPKRLASGVSQDSPITPFTALKSASSDYTPGIMRIAPAILDVSARIPAVFKPSPNTMTFCYTALPPTRDEVSGTMHEFGLPPIIYQDAYYSDERDVPDRSREYAGREFKLESTTVPYLPDFDPFGTSPAALGEKPPIVRDKAKEDLVYNRGRKLCTLRNWEIVNAPPSFAEVEQWIRKEQRDIPLTRELSGEVQVPSAQTLQREARPELSQIDGPTQKNKHGFKFSQKMKTTSVEHATQYMTLMSLEVHVNTRGNLAPDPAVDEIACIFWSIQADVRTAKSQYQTGILALSSEDGIVKHIASSVNVEVQYEEDELDLLNKMIDIVRSFDPDILTGYEVHNGSWGYLIERARVKYDFDLCDEFSRMKSQSHGRFGKEADRWGFNTTSTIRVTGRHMINIWRAMRGELNLLQYTMENVAFHVLHKRIPHYKFADLTRWYRSGKARDIAKTVNYLLLRVQINLQVLEANELIPRTSEQARILGVDFFSVFSRGSQFKVESIMFRIAKPENYILVSPSRKQVGQQNALECLPLIMEPHSTFYASPLLVLDFQSLYPSVMIAYNYCYSTFMGRIVNWRGTNKMGFTDFKRQARLLELVKDHLNIAPNGIMYVKPEIRKSLLAKMLGEILETRVMVKSGMKEDKDDKTLQQLLNNRQLALKLLANVTYGYTSASFSGRMPCSEIADSIVQTGRETLEKAIALIHSVERWGAEVVYGDTDSLFIYLKGRSRDQAFDIGQEIADAVTNANPRPVKLKFEKVYHPCVLLAKKRYVGFKYEHKNQKEPEFDAKGIETVRRDGTPAEQKIEEKALKILFRTQDLSQVKNYFQAQCTKIMTGKISIQDFLFAREVKLGTYSDKGPPPPGALIATRKMLQDPRQEPQYGERVPYVVITGAPGARLIDRCVDPEKLLKDDQVELDAEYYINKNLIPPLERIFNLVGANVRAWHDEMPKVQRVRTIRAPAQVATAGATNATKKTLESYLHSTTCLVCRSKLPPPPPGAHPTVQPLPICEECARKPAKALYALKTRKQKAERRVCNVRDICRSCSGLAFGEEVRCDSRDCPVFYTRVKEESVLEGLSERIDGVVEVLEGQNGNGSLEW